MPPKQVKRKMTESYTLRLAIDFINSLENAQGSKDNYIRYITNVVANAENDKDYLDTTTAELIRKHEEVDIAPLIKDFDKTSDVIENKIQSKQGGGELAIATKKGYYGAVKILFVSKAGCFIIDTEIKQKYSERFNHFATIDNENRRQNKPIRANEEFPDFTWQVMQQGYQEYISSHKFSNSEKGRADLKAAVLVGLYVLQRPRRVDDWHEITWYSKLPSEAEREGKNFLHIEKNKVTAYIDRFKIRTMTRNNKKKEVLPTYIKELNPVLASHIKDYIKKCGIRDMSKRTKDEKKKDTQFDIFHLKDDPEKTYKEAGGLGDVIQDCIYRIYKVKGKTRPSANTIRHNFGVWVTNNINEFTDEQLRQIAIDVGDTPKDLPTNLRYRIANQNNVGKTKTEILEDLEDKRQAFEMLLEAVDEGGSVAGDDPKLVSFPNIEDVEDDGDIVSPLQSQPKRSQSLDELYRLYGYHLMEAERIKKSIEALTFR